MKNKHLKAVAYRIMGKALRLNIIKRPKKCSKCKKDVKPEAHHSDYAEPLKIMWLCRSCHSSVHYKRNRDKFGSLIHFEIDDELKQRFDIILIKKHKTVKVIGRRLFTQFVEREEKKLAPPMALKPNQN